MSKQNAPHNGTHGRSTRSPTSKPTPTTKPKRSRKHSHKKIVPRPMKPNRRPRPSKPHRPASNKELAMRCRQLQLAANTISMLTTDIACMR